MGIVARQSIKNFFWSNIGIILGALYTFLLIPKAFDSNPSQWGLIQIIIYYNQILLPVSLLSIPTVIIRYFPSFKKEERSDSLFSLSLMIVITAAILIGVLFAIFREHVLADEESVLAYSQYTLIVVPILILSSVFEVFAAWSKVNLKSTLPNFLKDSFLKIWNFLMVLLFYFGVIRFNTLIILYFSIYVVQVTLMFGYIRRYTEFTFRPNLRILTSTFKKSHYSYMLFSVLGTAAFTLMNKVDVIMIGKMLSLDEVAFYSIGLALVAFVQLPERSISAISVPALSHLLDNEDHDGILTLYRKTSINQMVISSFIFLGIWINMHNVSSYLGSKFGNIEYVVLFLGLAKIVDVCTGLNGPLIGISKYYRSALVMQLILVVFVVASNLVFIPRYGYNGAAFASFISLSLYNIIKTLFVYSKFRIWPFTYKTLLALLIVAVSLAADRFLPVLEGFWTDLLVRSGAFTVLYISMTLALRISDDLNAIARNLVSWNRRDPE